MLPSLAQAVVAALPTDQPSIDSFLFDPAETAAFGRAPAAPLDHDAWSRALAAAATPEAEAAELLRGLRAMQARGAAAWADERLAWHRAVVDCAALPACVVADVGIDTSTSRPWYRSAVGLARTFLREHPRAVQGDQAMFVLADGLRHLGELEQAAVWFEEIPERFPRASVAALAHREAADCWFLANDPQSAVDSYLAALGARADSVYVLYRLAWAHHALGDDELAIDRMKQAADQARVRRDIGGVLVHQESLEDLAYWTR